MKHGVLLLAALVALAGCRSSETRTARRAGDRLRLFAETIRAGEQIIEDALVSLKAMRENPEADQTAMFNTFRNEMALLEDLTRKSRSRGEAAVEEKEQYLEEWGRNLESIQDHALRETSKERRREVKRAFAEVLGSFETARSSFRPLYATLKDLRTMLANDLSAGGIRAVEGTIATADAGAIQARKDLAAVRQQVEDLAEMIAPAKDEDDR
ncbi:MAG: DUF2959 family protein [Planctomycetota bacterium]